MGDCQECKCGELLYWQTPVKSGITFGSGVLLYVLLEYFGYTLITLLCRLTQVAIISFGIYHAIFVKDQPKTIDFATPIQQCISNLSGHVTCAVQCFYSALTWTDKSKSFKALLSLQVAYWVFSILDIETVLFLVWVGLFSVPLFYKWKKPECDKAIELAKQQINNGLGQACSALPPAVHNYATKCGITLPKASNPPPKKAGGAKQS